MNKYRDKSAPEINKAVAIALGAYEVATDIFIDKNRRFEFDKPKSQFFFDPCNNPADAMPIIIENKIAIAFSSNMGKWCAYAWYMMGDHGWDIYERPTICAFSDSYYRAAMEVFLMMKDAENE